MVTTLATSVATQSQRREGRNLEHEFIGWLQLYWLAGRDEKFFRSANLNRPHAVGRADHIGSTILLDAFHEMHANPIHPSLTSTCSYHRLWVIEKGYDPSEQSRAESRETMVLTAW